MLYLLRIRTVLQLEMELCKATLAIAGGSLH